MAEPDVLAALTRRREEDLGRRGVAVLLEEVVLDLPDVVDAQAISQLDLRQRILEQAMLGAFRPGPRQLVFVQKSEAHGSLLSERSSRHRRPGQPLS